MTTVEPFGEVHLAFAVVRAFPGTRCVQVVFPDGRDTTAHRPDTPDNRAEAAAEGYGTAPDAIWRCLVDHELLHCLIPEWAWGIVSPVLRTAAGEAGHPYHLRLYEESLVIGFQTVVNGHRVPPQLAPYWERLPLWADRLANARSQLLEV